MPYTYSAVNIEGPAALQGRIVTLVCLVCVCVCVCVCIALFTFHLALSVSLTRFEYCSVEDVELEAESLSRIFIFFKNLYLYQESLGRIFNLNQNALSQGGKAYMLEACDPRSVYCEYRTFCHGQKKIAPPPPLSLSLSLSLSLFLFPPLSIVYQA